MKRMMRRLMVQLTGMRVLQRVMVLIGQLLRLLSGVIPDTAGKRRRGPAMGAYDALRVRQVLVLAAKTAKPHKPVLGY